MAIYLFYRPLGQKNGTEYLIEASAKLCGDDLEFQLVPIGNGPLEADLQDTASNARIPAAP
jgi:hypothetical protein